MGGRRRMPRTAEKYCINTIVWKTIAATEKGAKYFELSPMFKIHITHIYYLIYYLIYFSIQFSLKKFFYEALKKSGASLLVLLIFTRPYWYWQQFSLSKHFYLKWRIFFCHIKYIFKVIYAVFYFKVFSSNTKSRES